MSDYSIAPFGNINLANPDAYYDAEMSLNGRMVQLDLNFEEENIPAERLEAVTRMIGQLAEQDKRNRQYMAKDYADEDADSVRLYIETHLEETDPGDLSALIDLDHPEHTPEEQMLEKLYLLRVGFYPDRDDMFAVFDYTLDEDLSNYLIVLNIKENGDLDYITMES